MGALRFRINRKYVYKEGCLLQKHLTYKQYRATDLILFAIIFVALEGITATLANKLVNVNFTITFCYLLASLVIMRWGAWGAVHCVLSGVTYALASKGDVMQIVSFAVGNLFALSSLIYLKAVGKDKVSKSFALSSVFVIIIYLFTAIGRSVMLSIFKGVNFFGVLTASLTTDVLSLVITLLVVFIARRQDGLFEDQKAYLFRTQEERDKSLRDGD